MARTITLLLAALSLASCEYFWVAHERVWIDESLAPEQRLEWQNPASNESVNTQEPDAYCNGLTWDGYEDWRLPTFAELASLWSPEYHKAGDKNECHWKKGLWGECGRYLAAGGKVVDFNSGDQPTGSPSGEGGDLMARCVMDPASGADASTDADTVETIDAPDAPETPPGLVWVPIPSGTYEMGCSPGDGTCESFENSSHPVTVSAFEMTETEITQGQYLAVTGSNPSLHAGCGDCPVEQVTWYQAKAFCEAIGGRLPSEAEWEYAARGGTVTPWTCGDATSSCLSDIAWYSGNEGGASNPVKGKGVNGFGLYDMLGNVWEWVEDCWHGDYMGAPSSGIVWTDGADCTYRVLRGGSWSAVVGNLRVSKRERDNPDLRNVIGLRCAR